MAAIYYNKSRIGRVLRRNEWVIYAGFIDDDYPDPNKEKNMAGGSIAGKTNWKHWHLIEVGTPDPIARSEGVRLRAGLFNEDKNQLMRGFYSYPPHPYTGDLPIWTYLPLEWDDLVAWAKHKGSDLPRPEFVVFGGNFIEIIGEINNDYIFRTMPMNNLDITSTPERDPLRWQKMTSVSRDGTHGDAPRGYEFVFPIVSDTDRARLEKSKVEIVDSFTPLWVKPPVIEFPEQEERPMVEPKDFRAYGIDYSVRNQIAYDRAASRYPHAFVAIRGGYRDVEDRTREAHPVQRTFSNAVEAGELEDVPLRMMYFWQAPQFDPKKQAAKMVELFRRFPGYFHALIQDIEGWGGYVMEKQYGEDAWVFKQEVEQATGLPLIKYTNPKTIMELWQLGVRWLAEDDGPLMIAQYPYSMANPNPSFPMEAVTLPEKWKPWLPPYCEHGWKFWQCSADENAAFEFGLDNGVQSKAVDWQVFNGTQAELKTYFGLNDDVLARIRRMMAREKYELQRRNRGDVVPMLQ